MDSNSDDKEALVFKPSQASWALVKFVAEPPAVLARAFVYALAAVVPATFVAMYLFKIQVSPTSTGVIVPRTALLKLYAPKNLMITQVHVRQNELIKAGQGLYSVAAEAGSRAPASAAGHLQTSPVDGSVIGIHVSPQTPIRDGEVALTLLPNSTPLEVEVEIPNNVLDMVHEEMSAQIIVADSRAQEVILGGVVREIQSDLNEDSRERPVFKVRVEFKAESLPKLRIGQAVQVRFGVRQERLITIVVNKILNRESFSL